MNEITASVLSAAVAIPQDILSERYLGTAPEGALTSLTRKHVALIQASYCNGQEVKQLYLLNARDTHLIRMEDANPIVVPRAAGIQIVPELWLYFSGVTNIFEEDARIFVNERNQAPFNQDRLYRNNDEFYRALFDYLVGGFKIREPADFEKYLRNHPKKNRRG